MTPIRAVLIQIVDWRSMLAFVVVSGAILLASPAVEAQENPGESGAAPAPVIRLEELLIEGRVQQPEAFYILPRTRLNYEGVEREQSFLHRVSRTLDEPPIRLE